LGQKKNVAVGPLPDTLVYACFPTWLEPPIMTSTARSSKQRVASLRQRRQDADLRRLELWVHMDDVSAVKLYAARVAKKRAAGEKR
jgi:hypothetical protein